MGRRSALLIGNSVYDDPHYSPLRAPQADVESVARVLSASNIGGFDEVQTLIDQPMYMINQKVERFFKDRKRDDLLLLYFSGHGSVTKWGQLHLIGKDTHPELLISTAISSTFIKELMNLSGSKCQVLILDCCCSGAFVQGTKGSSQVGEHIVASFSGRGRVILTATSAVQPAWDGDGLVGTRSMSVFTHYLVQGLETGEADSDVDGLISVDELYEYVWDRILDEEYEQTPCKWAESQQGSIILAKSPRSLGVDLPPSSLRERETHSQQGEASLKYSSGVPPNTHVNAVIYGSARRFSFREQSELVEKLLACSSIRHGKSREVILKQLSAQICHAIERHTIDRFDVFNIVDACLHYSGGLDELIRIVQFFEGDSLSMVALNEFLNGISLADTSPSAPPSLGHRIGRPASVPVYYNQRKCKICGQPIDWSLSKTGWARCLFTNKLVHGHCYIIGKDLQTPRWCAICDSSCASNHEMRMEGLTV